MLGAERRELTLAGDVSVHDTLCALWKTEAYSARHAHKMVAGQMEALAAHWSRCQV